MPKAPEKSDLDEKWAQIEGQLGVAPDAEGRYTLERNGLQLELTRRCGVALSYYNHRNEPVRDVEERSLVDILFDSRSDMQVIDFICTRGGYWNGIRLFTHSLRPLPLGPYDSKEHLMAALDWRTTTTSSGPLGS